MHENGVPQGEALSPLLYSTHIKDTPTSLQNNTKIGLCADDTAY